MILQAWITLTAADLGEADRHAIERNELSHARGYHNKHGLGGDKMSDLRENILGARGELAACCVLNLPFEGRIDNFKEADAGSDIQIRTASDHRYRLIYRPDDNPDHVYVLVTTDLDMKTFCVRGWIEGSSALKAGIFETYGNRPPAYFVSQSFLQSIGLLMEKTGCPSQQNNQLDMMDVLNSPLSLSQILMNLDRS